MASLAQDRFTGADASASGGVVEGDIRPGQSRLHRKARAGAQRIEVGTIVSYDGPTHTAMVRLIGAQTNLVGPLPLSQGLSPALAVTGAGCLAVLLDETNPSDAVIAAIYTAPFAPWIQAGNASLVLSTAQGTETVSFPMPFAHGPLGITATSRDPAWSASVSSESASGFALSLTWIASGPPVAGTVAADWIAVGE
ncbi:MAG TPA: hypothetical protein VNL71_19290 [Chloroflexota bacterium]|nr:hypothetical protein [Chloroflexota bacterium]